MAVRPRVLPVFGPKVPTRLLLKGDVDIGIDVDMDIATWTSKVCRILAVEAVFGGFGPFFSILLGSRQTSTGPNGLILWLLGLRT